MKPTKTRQIGECIPLSVTGLVRDSTRPHVMAISVSESICTLDIKYYCINYCVVEINARAMLAACYWSRCMQYVLIWRSFSLRSTTVHHRDISRLCPVYAISLILMRIACEEPQIASTSISQCVDKVWPSVTQHAYSFCI